MLNSTIRNLGCQSRYLLTIGSSKVGNSSDKKFLHTSNNLAKKTNVQTEPTNSFNSGKVKSYSKCDKQESKYQYKSHSYFNKFTAGLGAAFAAIVAPFSFISLNSYCLTPTTPAKTQSEQSLSDIRQRLSVTQISANNPIEDRYCAAYLKQPNAFYLSVFDGHGGWQLSQFARKSLHLQLNKILINQKDSQIDDEKQQVSQAIARAFDIVEEKFLAISRTCFKHGFSRAGYVGACALVTLIKNNRIYCANAGDCQAILISRKKGQDGKDAYSYREMTYAFTSNKLQEQERLKKQFPNEQDIVKCRHQNACYVKGRLMPTRAFGDFALKHKDFNMTQFSRIQGYRNPIPNYTGPYITHKPDIKVHQINKDEDRFVIMGSDGLWDELSHQDVTDIVQGIVAEHEAVGGGGDVRHKISKSLLQKALEKAAKDRQMDVNQMLQIPLGKRRSYHDDITIAVVELAK